MQTFNDLDFPVPINKGLEGLGFTTPTPIQASVLPVALEGLDVMACAETGSGKTAAFLLPIVKKLLANPGSRALILAPTRELVMQISDFTQKLTTHCRQMHSTSLVGGADIRRQFRALKKKPQIIIATPGRLIDHLNRGSLKLKNTEFLVLDEGDRMLDMGFAPQLDEILKHLPKKRQTMMFTATLPGKVKKLAEQYLSSPKSIATKSEVLPVASIKQSVIQINIKEKGDRIVDELNQREGSVIIFSKTQRRTDSLFKSLREYGFSVDLIHGGRTQGQRNKSIQRFRQGRSKILCATDIASRGIDVPHVRHVINFDLPMLSEDYVHRIGRTARNGATGEAVSFVTPEEKRKWNLIAKRYKMHDLELEAPKGRTKDSKKSFRKRSNKKRSNSSFRGRRK